MRGVRGIIVKIVINAIAVWVASALIPAVGVNTQGTTRTVLSYLVVGALIGLVNAFIKPVVTFFAFPFIILSLGLMVLVVNALMLKLVDWLSHGLGIGFDAGPFFWSTIGAAIVISIVSMILNLVLPDE
jgi:putative membrane protein